METIANLLNTAISYIRTIGVSDAIDILIVAYLIYKTIDIVRRTNSKNVARAILLLLVVLVLSYAFGLTMINYLLRKAMELGLIALVVLFQPELRRLLERVGSSFSSSRSVSTPAMETAIAQTVLACSEMSETHTGALIIFERNEDLGSIINTGTLVNADITAELLKNLFYNKAPLHDGAVILRNNRIAAAGCVLPLTKSRNLSKDLGMRHRAGIGLSEQSDAVVVIVSEESGAISMAIDGMLKRHLNAAALTQLLHNELIIDEETKTWKEKLSDYLRRLTVRKRDEE
ncbi:MAG: diadenylate cyclase CdaA [Oscillospiraceae bacterium]|nr:diadenylate cyclase CdaA [Oscillospiraceae bacterium]